MDNGESVSRKVHVYETSTLHHCMFDWLRRDPADSLTNLTEPGTLLLPQGGRLGPTKRGPTFSQPVTSTLSRRTFSREEEVVTVWLLGTATCVHCNDIFGSWLIAFLPDEAVSFLWHGPPSSWLWLLGCNVISWQTIQTCTILNVKSSCGSNCGGR